MNSSLTVVFKLLSLVQFITILGLTRVFFSDVLMKYLEHNVTFRKSQIADLFLNPRFIRIPDDMNYYEGRLQQSHQITKMLFRYRLTL